MASRESEAGPDAAGDLDGTTQKYKALFEQSMDGIFLHDLDGAILDVNRVAVDQSGFTRDELLQMSVFDLIGGGAPRDPIVQQWREWPTSRAVLIEGAHRRKDGSEHPVEINTGKVQIGDRQLMLAIVRDLTERRQAERDRQRLEQQLQHAQKMEAVGRLAGGVAHDFNNMLCGILGNAELALDSLAAGDPLRPLLEGIITAGTQAADLTGQLLAYSRKQVTSPKVFDLSELIDAMEPMLVRLLGEDIILRTAARDRPAPVRADPGQIEQIVLNLAINARDAMPDGGELVIEALHVTLDAAYCASHADTTPGAHVMLAVSDTGAGMDAETRSRIFEPFFTTKELGKGTGLGLATVYGIVEQSNGRIEVYSEPGQGSTFKVYLPLAAQEAGRLDLPRTSAIPRGEETVLVVEDEAVVRDVAARLLGSCGYTVLRAASTAEALGLAQHHEGPIDLLLTDVIMPHMNGRELAARIVEARPGIRVLFASGYTENVIGHHGVLDDDVQFIPKPYSLATLATRVRDVLDG